MHHSLHHPVFVFLSLAVAILGSWTALDLFRRVANNLGPARLAWLATAALAMGLSIWSMHFVAMLGFDPGSAVGYDPLLTLVSLFLAIGATAGAFFVAAADGAGRTRVVLAGLLMGAGICLMHYVGMAALETAVSLGYDPMLVALSLAVAVGASTTALFVARRPASPLLQAVCATVLGLAIVGMHYTAMAALRLTPVADAMPVHAGTPPYGLASAVAGATILILFLALMASLYDQRGNILAALEAGGVGYWELDLRTMTLHISARGKAIFGLPPGDALSYAEALERIAPDARAERAAALAEAVRTGADYDVEYRLASNGRWVNARGRVVEGPDRRARRMVGVVIDITERRAAIEHRLDAERRQRLLIDELNHRVKNTLATVQAISRQTAKGAADYAAFQKSFEARLMALSATHNALTRGGWEEASLVEILEHELRPYGRDQVRLRGGPVALGPRQALAFGMAAHELVTNAAKYGALSVPEGVLEIEWFVAASVEGHVLTLRWTERGKPLVAQPTRRGFGSRLVRSSIEAELGGKVSMDFLPEGLRCTMEMPLRPAGAGHAEAAPEEPVPHNVVALRRAT